MEKMDLRCKYLDGRERNTNGIAVRNHLGTPDRTRGQFKIGGGALVAKPVKTLKAATGSYEESSRLRK